MFTAKQGPKDESGTTKLLQEASKQKSASFKEKMRFLSQTFLTHREMGESEAIYRLFPNLHLSESNVTCIFVSTGFPHERSRFLKRIEENQTDKRNSITLQEYEGEYQLATSIHEKYSGRPLALKHICLAQFAIWYDTLSDAKGKKLSFINGVTSLSVMEDQKILSWCKKYETQLPLHIKLAGGKLGYMKLRTFPKVLRIHKFKLNTTPHDFFYSELLLYRPWHTETELFADNFTKCHNLYWETNPQQLQEPMTEQKSYLEQVKEKLFPLKNSVEEARALMDIRGDKAQHIGELLDPESELANEEALGQNIVEDELTAARDPGDLLDICHDGLFPEKTRYQRIDIGDIDSMSASVQTLIPEQRYVFDMMIAYCKEKRKSFSNSSLPKPKPPLLVIHGGAGAGKSKLINDIALWVEYFFRTNNNSHPDQPIVLKVAPTGKAASLIGGMTLHHAFHFNFSNDHTCLPENIRETTRQDLAKLEVVIVDEMSMVKSDLLYQLHTRLQEIKQCGDDFGGVSLLLFGDLMQLQPVKANWIFETPKNKKFAQSHALRPLWDLFLPIELKQNHRQGADKKYAQILNRIRYGSQTEYDLSVLQTRLNVPQNQDALVVFGKRKPVTEWNKKKLAELPGQLELILAKTIHPCQKKFKPFISSDGFVNNTPFLAQLYLKTNARVMLTYNSDTSDGLTNGSTGTVTGFKKYPNGTIYTIYVLFDDPNSGKKAQMKMFPNDKHDFPESTPIHIHKFDFSLGRLAKGHTAKATVYQFPLTLAWALTAHKCQGQTVKKPNQLVADLKSVFTSGQAYVILGRVQDIEQLCLLSFPNNCIKVNEKAKEAALKIAKAAVNNLQNNWNNAPSDSIKLALLNIRSLVKHHSDLKSDNNMLLADVICLTETHLQSSSNVQYHLEEFSSFFLVQGKSAGVAMYIKDKYKPFVPKTYCLNKCQILKVECKTVDIVTVYRSPNYKTTDHLLQKLYEIITPEKATILCGDFNIPTAGSKFQKALQIIGFHQIVSFPTHIAGNTIDHVYIKFQDFKIMDVFQHSVYYSDHDTVCAILKYHV